MTKPAACFWGPAALLPSLGLTARLQLGSQAGLARVGTESCGWEVKRGGNPLHAAASSVSHPPSRDGELTAKRGLEKGPPCWRGQPEEQGLCSPPHVLILPCAVWPAAWAWLWLPGVGQALEGAVS